MLARAKKSGDSIEMMSATLRVRREAFTIES
jgi:hypothetical protein